MDQQSPAARRPQHGAGDADPSDRGYSPARVTIGLEKLDALLADGFEDLLFDHWQEVGRDQEAVPLAPNWDEYRKLEAMGRHKIIAMRDGVKLVGYNAFFVHSSLNYRHTVFALNNVIWLMPDYRAGWNGVRLLRQSEKMMRELGAVKLFYHIKLHVKLGAAASGTFGDLLVALGYRLDEQGYSKLLGV